MRAWRLKVTDLHEAGRGPAYATDDVDAILGSARINNPLDGMTGVLIFNGSTFMQIMEGSEAAVDGLVDARLRSDRRHSNMSICDEPDDREPRTFPDWAMAYLRLEKRGIRRRGGGGA